METFTYAEINATGRANLVKWLRDVLKEPERADAWAASLIENHDGSFPDQSQSVEVSAHVTKRGCVQDYRFGSEELDIVIYDGDGNRLHA